MNYIIENQYFGCINWYLILFKSSNCTILQYESYQKMSFRNRCTIVGANGLIDLSIPVVGGRNTKQNFLDVEISNTCNWQQQHWKAIQTCYAKAPFFEYYGSLVENIIFSAPKNLFEFNLWIVEKICKLLKFEPPIVNEKKITDILSLGEQPFYNRWKPKNFENEKLMSPYYQLFANRVGFKNNLSILDLLFNEGPNATTILKAADLPL
jgi:WbqC-like protein family